jgi:putative FmdB family regulatory protein
MPTYEYACSSCGTHIEVYQRFSDESLTKCGVCGGELRKVFHPAGILFKGSGFYKTDSRSGRTGAAAKSSGDGDSKTSEKSPTSEKSTASKDTGSTTSSSKETTSSSKEKTA